MEDKKKLTIAMIGQKGIELKEGAGGVERHVAELATRLAKKGHHVLVYTRPRFFNRKKIAKNIELVSVRSIATKNLDTFTHTLLATLSVLFKKVDIVHYHGIGPATVAWLPRLFKRKSKVIVTFHSVDRFHGKWGIFARAFLHYGELAAVKFPHATIAVSKSIKNYCKKKYKADVCYIPNGTVVEKYPGKNKLAKWNLKQNNYILVVARLVRQKGVHYLIKAYKKLKTDKKLVIVGAPSFSEDYFKYLKHLATGHKNIIFTGFQKGEALAQLYANSYLYVHPSEAEGLPMSVLEAMAAGRCVLVSDIPENLEAIGKTGITFKSADTRDLQVKLKNLLKNKKKIGTLGKSAKERVKEKYSWKKVLKQVEDLYKSIVFVKFK